MRLGAVVVDVRFMPFSRTSEWGKESLERAFRGGYVWIRGFGNRNYKGGPIAIEDFAGGCQALGRYALSRGYDPILLCTCADVETCHRKVVADRIAAEMGWPVEHLQPARRPEQGGLW